ncbi:ABC transporter substrate-binding protein [Chthonobacter albigriseus]|uniref:ABC transporter substrate-binding protein n=1 Tax=Chthonobacter albigriseus TaxID=1683161 RepID=UPI0015EEABFC|nr:ABC transporter substrate-binding protein [Chthonobacter albigriseus]
MKKLAKTFILAFTMLAAPSIADAASLEVEHYWISPSENAAIMEIRKGFEARGGTWIDSPMANLETLRTDLAERLAVGTPPGASQWYAGAASKEYIQLGAIVPIEVAGGTEAWKSKLPSFVVDRISVDGVIYLAPVGIHVENWMWINKKIFDRHQLTPPKTWPEVVEVAHRLKEAGETPFALSSDTWTVNLFLRAVFTGVFSDPQDRALINDWRGFIASQKFEEALVIIDQLAELIDMPDTPRDWVRANEEFAAGQGAIEIMGDWAKAELMAKGLEPGRDFLCEFAPGNQRYLATVVDSMVFMHPEDDEIRAGQALLAETIMDPEIQSAFSRAKGSTPANQEAKAASLDACAAKVKLALADPTLDLGQFTVDFPSYGTSRFWNATRRLLIEPATTVEETLAIIRGMANDPQMN